MGFEKFKKLFEKKDAGGNPMSETETLNNGGEGEKVENAIAENFQKVGVDADPRFGDDTPSRPVDVNPEQAAKIAEQVKKAEAAQVEKVKAKIEEMPDNSNGTDTTSGNVA